MREGGVGGPRSGPEVLRGMRGASEPPVEGPTVPELRPPAREGEEEPSGGGRAIPDPPPES